MRQETPTPSFDTLEPRLLLSSSKPHDTFTVTTLVASPPTTSTAVRADSNLINGWGLDAAPGGPFWISDNGTGLSTAYDGTGAPVPPVVTIPAPVGSSAGHSGPTGVVFTATAFTIHLPGGATTTAEYAFVTEDGTVAAWQPSLGSSAVTVADNSASGAVYKGVAVGTAGTVNYVYAADFHNNRIDVFDSNFAPVTLPAVPGPKPKSPTVAAFTDTKLKKGYAPFNIQNVGGKLYVEYALRETGGDDEVAGKGKGIVDVFNTDGSLVRRFATGGSLNAPWAVTVAPTSFGSFANDILVGNFGDGRINAFDPVTGKSRGQLMGADKKPLAVSGLWGLSNAAAANADRTALYFAAGPNDEAAGLFGKINISSATPQSQGSTGSDTPAPTDPTMNPFPYP